MEKNAFVKNLDKFGLVIISTCVAFMYWRIESLNLGTTSTQWITFFFFIAYGFLAQYFINSQKRMMAEIISLSISDHLTGLHNRRGFLTLADQQLKLSDRTMRGMLLFFADLDGLKQINDSLGHEEGDKALIETASVLKESFRSSDIIARMGGDEFAILAIDPKDSNSEVLIKRLQNQIDWYNNKKNRKYKLSISIGCSFYDPENPSSIDKLMASADKLMYEHKKNKKSGTVSK